MASSSRSDETPPERRGTSGRGTRRVRLTLYLPPDAAARLAILARHAGETPSSVGARLLTEAVRRAFEDVNEGYDMGAAVAFVADNVRELTSRTAARIHRVASPLPTGGTSSRSDERRSDTE